MNRFRSRLASVALLAVAAIAACNSEAIIDDWGRRPATHASRGKSRIPLELRSSRLKYR